MKITDEWIIDQIELSEKNLEFLNSLSDKDSDLSSLKNLEKGQIYAFNRVLHRQNQSHKSCKIFPISVPQWKRNIIRFLTHICDWLEGVDDKDLFKRDIMEIRSDNARKKSLKHKKI